MQGRDPETWSHKDNQDQHQQWEVILLAGTPRVTKMAFTYQFLEGHCTKCLTSILKTTTQFVFLSLVHVTK